MNARAQHELSTSDLVHVTGSIFTYQTRNGTARFVINERLYPTVCPMILWRPNGASSFTSVDEFAWSNDMTMESIALTLDAERQQLIDLAPEARERARSRVRMGGHGVRRNHRYIGGTGGHRYADRIDGNQSSEHVDLRVRGENRTRRSNMCDRIGKRSYVPTDRTLPGTHYDRLLYCTKCHHWKTRGQFANMAVEGRIRHRNGSNIRCRNCQPRDRQYEHGYKLDEFVMHSGDAHSEDGGNADYDDEWSEVDAAEAEDDEEDLEWAAEDPAELDAELADLLA